MADKIIYTLTDEAPMLATFSLLPIIQVFAKAAGLPVEVRDISLSGRVISLFPERLTDAQKQADDLTELGELAKSGKANIIKLPNISASVPQLISCIKELQSQGYNVPDYPAEPQNEEETALKAKYAKVLGSAVNPVLREGNSDRRVASAVKQYAQKNPHKMGQWSKESKSHVSHMGEGDYYGSEKSLIMDAEDTVKIEFFPKTGESKVLKDGLKLQAKEVIDTAVMSAKKLRDFFEKEIQDCKEKNILFSLHLKATMMKVSDPIFFGHCVSVFYKDVFEKHGDVLAKVGVNPNNGIGDVYSKITSLPEAKQAEIKADIEKVYENRAGLAMVDSDRGITNLHVPSDIIVDASMPVVVRDSGCMWNKDNKLQDVKCCIPDRSYARVYKACVDDCRANGQFDVKTMGNVPNVGLMAQKAEEYGSHDKTFELSSPGVVKVIDSSGKVLMEQNIEEKDVFRMCQAKDAPIKDWVKLAVKRARATGAKAIFWLDSNRAHDANLIKKVTEYLKEEDLNGLDIEILDPVKAICESMKRARNGENTISVTGNVLRDYLTDLFPILELGTSAKMLSIVPMLAGGGMYETGAGGSAPKHVQQFVAEGHTRWDSLGEFLALACSLEDLGSSTNNKTAILLSQALNKATGMFLDNRKSPSRVVNQIDNRGSHFWLCLYWAQAVSEQDEDKDLKTKFQSMYNELHAASEKISQELIDCQGKSVDIGGYYHPCINKLKEAMRPSITFNSILDKYH